MFNLNKVAPSAAIIALSLIAGACTSASSEDTAARVGSRDITLKQIDSVIKQQLDASNVAASPLGSAELVAARLSVLSTLIQNEVLFLKAQKENLVPDDNKVAQEIEKRKQAASFTEDQFQNELKQAGLSIEEYKDQVRKELAINSLNDREKARVKAPSEDEIKKYYEDHKAEFVADRGALISMIVTDPADNSIAADAKGDAAAEQKIRSIYDTLKAGRDFATVAAQASEDFSRNQRGSIGFASEAQLKQSFATRPEIPARLMSMSPGQYTEPFKDNLSGKWYIFKLDDKREQAQDLTLEHENVRRSIVDTLTQQRQQVLLNALLMVAMAETTVKNYFAERIVQQPETVATMTPSQLLERRSQPAQPQPRIENENNQSNANRPATNTNGNANATRSANSNR